MLYIEGIRAGFILPQKVASTSIKSCLRESLNISFSDWKGFDKDQQRDILPADGLVIVGAIRNPFDRVVSCYHDQAIKGRYGKIATFTDFVKFICDTPQDKADKHFAPYKGMEHADIVIRFERLSEDWVVVRKLLPVLKDLGKVENKTIGRMHWSSYYDDRLLGMVYNYYSKDFGMWGY